MIFIEFKNTVSLSPISRENVIRSRKNHVKFDSNDSPSSSKPFPWYFSIIRYAVKGLRRPKVGFFLARFDRDKLTWAQNKPTRSSNAAYLRTPHSPFSRSVLFQGFRFRWNEVGYHGWMGWGRLHFLSKEKWRSSLSGGGRWMPYVTTSRIWFGYYVRTSMWNGFLLIN